MAFSPTLLAQNSTASQQGHAAPSQLEASNRNEAQSTGESPYAALEAGLRREIGNERVAGRQIDAIKAFDPQMQEVFWASFEAVVEDLELEF